MTQFIVSIRLAVSALVANKMRGALTTLGVVIGIFFVLLMGWLLTGLDNVLDETLATFGDDILYVDKYNWAGDAIGSRIATGKASPSTSTSGFTSGWHPRRSM